MIKLKKIVAVAMAATMIMGLSMTASAMNISSPFNNPADDTQGSLAAQNVKMEATDANGEAIPDENVEGIEETSKAAKSISTQKKLEAVLRENGLTPAEGKNVEYVPIYSAYLTNVPVSRAADGGYTFTFTMGDFQASGQDPAKFQPGDEVYAMMETGVDTGTWEVVPLTVNDKGEVEVTVNHDGAFVLFKVLDNGEVIKLEKTSANDPGTITPIDPTVPVDPTNPIVPVNPEEPGNSQNPSNGQNANGAANANGAVNGTNGVWTSPKTGEF